MFRYENYIVLVNGQSISFLFDISLIDNNSSVREKLGMYFAIKVVLKQLKDVFLKTSI